MKNRNDGREPSVTRLRRAAEVRAGRRASKAAGLLTAIILLLAGILIWSSLASIDSFVTGTAQVEHGSMRILLDDEQFSGSVQPGMTVKVGESESRISSTGTGASGAFFATAETTLADGSYPARIVLRRTQVIRLLFN